WKDCLLTAVGCSQHYPSLVVVSSGMRSLATLLVARCICSCPHGLLLAWAHEAHQLATWASSLSGQAVQPVWASEFAIHLMHQSDADRSTSSLAASFDAWLAHGRPRLSGDVG
ncbi:hypothetical protein Dimus_022443, partial [Dionaea muscipula]